jgi:hypothetical protein
METRWHVHEIHQEMSFRAIRSWQSWRVTEEFVFQNQVSAEIG